MPLSNFEERDPEEADPGGSKANDGCGEKEENKE